MLTYAQYDPVRGEQRYFEGRIALQDGTDAAASRRLALWRCLGHGPAYWGTTCRPWAEVGVVTEVWQHVDRVGVKVRLSDRPMAAMLWRLARNSRVALTADVLGSANGPMLSPLMIITPDTGDAPLQALESGNAQAKTLGRAGRRGDPPPPASRPLFAL